MTKISNKRVRKAALIFVVFLSIFDVFMLSNARGEGGPTEGPGGAAMAVLLFCESDARGLRINNRRDLIFELLVSEAGEPGWDVVDVIDHYEVIDESYNERSAKVVVSYHVLGKQSGAGQFSPDRHVETVTFELSIRDGRWKIVGPVVPPHVYKRRIDEIFGN